MKPVFAFVGGKEKEMHEFFKNILYDYCKRFNVKDEDLDIPDRIIVCGVDSTNSVADGTTSQTDNGVIHVQVGDPLLMWGAIDPTSANSFVTLLAHELIHVCQHITMRAGIAVDIPFDPEDSLESYFFEKHELEAYLLDDFYAMKFGEKLLDYGQGI
jgi:hypothetical protein